MDRYGRGPWRPDGCDNRTVLTVRLPQSSAIVFRYCPVSDDMHRTDAAAAAPVVTSRGGIPSSSRAVGRQCGINSQTIRSFTPSRPHLAANASAIATHMVSIGELSLTVIRRRAELRTPPRQDCFRMAPNFRNVWRSRSTNNSSNIGDGPRRQTGGSPCRHKRWRYQDGGAGRDQPERGRDQTAARGGTRRQRGRDQTAARAGGTRQRRGREGPDSSAGAAGTAGRVMGRDGKDAR
jgi:hypothetical protein